MSAAARPAEIRTEAPNLGAAWAEALIEELVRSGLRHAVVSPGSRSAPLALACATHAELDDHPVLDERSAAFFALGLARARREPVALVCTSGTAAANYLPATVEAHYAGVPLLLLTADRPPELRECGAGQTVDQVGLYTPFVRFAADVSAPRSDDHAFRQLRSLACRAWSAAAGPPAGPVHLNLPFRDPLSPIAVPEQQRHLRDRSSLAARGREREPFARVAPAIPPAPAPETLRTLATLLGAEPHGWITVGPWDATPAAAAAVAELARRSGWPLLVEPLSQLRCGGHDRGALVPCHDTLLRSRAFAAEARPRWVLRFGAAPTARVHRDLLDAHAEIRQIVVDPHGWSEPTARAEEIVRADPEALACALQAQLPEAPSAQHVGYRERWLRAGRIAEAAVSDALSSDATLHEPAIVRTLAAALPDDTTVFTGSSMPVRDVDSFWPSSDQRVRFVGNRGANGIDGSLSTVLGLAAGAGPCVALLGDLTLLHDVSGLLLARAARVDATVVVVDNGGGGIFELLPVAGATERALFERHFATPPAADLGDLVRGFGVPLEEVRTPTALAAALERSFDAGGVRVIRAFVDRSASAPLRARLQRRVDDALAAGGCGG